MKAESFSIVLTGGIDTARLANSLKSILSDDEEWRVEIVCTQLNNDP